MNPGEIKIKLSVAVDTATLDRLLEIAKAAQVLTDLIVAFECEIALEPLQEPEITIEPAVLPAGIDTKEIARQISEAHCKVSKM